MTSVKPLDLINIAHGRSAGMYEVEDVKAAPRTAGAADWDYTLTLRNSGEYGVLVNVRIQYLDADGREVADLMIYDVSIPAQSRLALSGFDRGLAPATAARIAAVQADFA